VRNGQFNSYTIDPKEFGFTRCKKEELTGGAPEENAKITRNILSGEKGAKRDSVVLNAAAAIYIANPSLSMHDSIKIAQDVIDSGKALDKLNQFIAMSRETGK
jgi:anthranilate phosphoribosyltransferase